MIIVVIILITRWRSGASASWACCRSLAWSLLSILLSLLLLLYIYIYIYTHAHIHVYVYMYIYIYMFIVLCPLPLQRRDKINTELYKHKYSVA